MAHNIARWTKDEKTYQGRIITALTVDGEIHLVIMGEDGKVHAVPMTDVNS